MHCTSILLLYIFFFTIYIPYQSCFINHRALTLIYNIHDHFLSQKILLSGDLLDEIVQSLHARGRKKNLGGFHIVLNVLKNKMAGHLINNYLLMHTLMKYHW